jgi:outer membrane protein assembly factor BamB
MTFSRFLSIPSFNIVTLLLLLAGDLCGEDWPQWRGPNRDGKVAGFNSPATWPAALAKKWDVTVGSGVANPSLVGNRLFVIAREEENEVVRCLDATSGEEIWKDSYASERPEGYGAGNGRFIGPRATPTVADGRVITLSANGLLTCYDATSGQLKWRKDEFVGKVPGFYTSSSPIVVDGMCIVQLGAGGGEGARPGETELGALIAYDLATGEEKWRAKEGSPAYASPVTMTVDGMKVVIALSETQLVAVDLANGKVVWMLPLRQGRYNSSSPVVDGQTLIFAGPGTRGLTALKLSRVGQELKEEVTWTYDDNQLIFNTPVIKDGALYGLSTRDQLFVVNPDHTTGWTAPIVPTPAATTQSLISAQAVFALQQQTEGRAAEAAAPQRQGERRGRGRGRGRGRPSGGGERPGYGSVVDAGSVMAALCPGGDLVFFKPDATAYTELARYKVSEDGDVYSHPILSGDRIYIKDRDSISMWTTD